LEAQQAEDSSNYSDEDMSEFDPEVLEYFVIIVDDLRKSLRTITWPAQQQAQQEDQAAEVPEAEDASAAGTTHTHSLTLGTTPTPTHTESKRESVVYWYSI
jgi:hypothetical protein